MNYYFTTKVLKVTATPVNAKFDRARMPLSYESNVDKWLPDEVRPSVPDGVVRIRTTCYGLRLIPVKLASERENEGRD